MKRQDRMSASDLAEGLLAQIQALPRTSKELQIKFGYSRSVVNSRLADLQSEGLVHCERITGHKRGGSHTIWKGGPGKGSAQRPPRPAVKAFARNDGQPYQHTFQVYPVVGKRDELDTYLFGPARAPIRCVCCQVEQGRGHLANCMFAQVAA
jgi:hypothetical protein